MSWDWDQGLEVGIEDLDFGMAIGDWELKLGAGLEIGIEIGIQIENLFELERLDLALDFSGGCGVVGLMKK